MEEEGLPFKKCNFYDNRSTMDELLNKPIGVIHLLDEANRLHQDSNFLISKIDADFQQYIVETIIISCY